MYFSTVNPQRTGLALLLALVICTVKSYGQAFQYLTFTFGGSVSALSNYKYIPIQQQPYYQGSFNYGFSISQEANLHLGISYLSTYINFGKEPHSICDQEDNSCFAESWVQYINLPITFELYQNGGKVKSKSYYHLNMIPLFSYSERTLRTEIFETPLYRIELDDQTVDGFKFQDFHLGFALGTDISLTRKLKFFIEPSIQHSILFRKEDLVNPNYIISLRLGIRIRTYRR